MTTQTTSLHTFFECIPDYRINRNKKHLLSDIIILSILAVICGAESWDSIELFGKTKFSFLKTFLKLPNGIPSHDTINRVFSSLHPRLFEEAFIKWVDSLRDEDIKKEVISLDSKYIRGSKDSFHEKNPSSVLGNASSFNSFIRRHWGIENRLHWTLDMVFDEDRQRKRIKNSAQNFSFIRKIALDLLKKDTSKGSLVSKRLRAGWDDTFLLHLLNI